MIHENKKQAILDKIREVCDLKRLEFGCDVKAWDLGMWMHKASLNYYTIYTEKKSNVEDSDVLDKVLIATNTGWETKGIAWKPKEGEAKRIEIFKRWEQEPEILSPNIHKDFEIIGLPVELNHLLYAIEKNKGGKTISLGLYSDGKMSMIDYSDMEQDNSVELDYNLTLTVEQNLDNEALADLIYELIV